VEAVKHEKTEHDGVEVCATCPRNMWQSLIAWDDPFHLLRMGDPAAVEAFRRYPANYIVEDPTGETGWAESDPYGYEEYAARAFIAGAKWAQKKEEA
jgi:hypothetical protein